jgi:trans-feruloyl-CoA hydratase/vanillin synthase
MSYETLQLDVGDDVATITLDRLDAKNALNPLALEEIGDALEEVRDEIKVLVFTGQEDSFCSGLDLEKFFKEARIEGPEAVRENTKHHHRALRGLKNFPQITIAKVNGWTVGAGYMIMAICDLAIASEDAMFSLSEINFGHPPGGGTMWSVVNTLPRRDALWYSLTGEPFDAEEADEKRVVNEVVANEEFDDRVAEVVADLTEKEPLALEYTKKFFDKTRWMTFDEAHDYELAKGEEMKYYQGYEFLNEGIGQFSDDVYRPATGQSYDRSAGSEDESD